MLFRSKFIIILLYVNKRAFKIRLNFWQTLFVPVVSTIILYVIVNLLKLFIFDAIIEFNFWIGIGSSIGLVLIAIIIVYLQHIAPQLEGITYLYQELNLTLQEHQK